jgi:iron uptake system EfeUOB component EfeO/EfeM
MSSPKHLSRSARLRKYEVAYEECLKKMSCSKKSPDKKSRVRQETPPEIKQKSPQKKNEKPLNSYQKFVQDESQKSKYKGLIASERMTAISKEWKKQKDKL